jgi:hypothetical protein
MSEMIQFKLTRYIIIIIIIIVIIIIIYLFIHPCCYTSNIGHVNHNLQFVHYNITYNIPYNI